MNYFEFLAQWYNLPWLAATLAGLVAAVWDRRRPRPARDTVPPVRISLTVLLLVTGIVGLTLNGAIHDLALGQVGPRQRLVAPVALAVGWVAAWGGPRLRRRVLPPVTGVRFNEPGLEGEVAVVLSRVIVPGADPGRARHHAADGVSHIVRVTPKGDGALRFGMKVTLGRFDGALRAYVAEPA